MKLKPKKRIRSRTTKRAKEERLYKKRADVWLQSPEHRYCEVMLAMGLPAKPSEEVHHRFGRRGKLLLDERYWHAVSRPGHDFLHANPCKARMLGLLCLKGCFNSQPRES